MSAISRPTTFLSRKDAEGVTVGQALDSIGYRGAAPVGTQKFSGFVELHIEQGPILEAENKTIGVVDSGQGVLWYDGKITGFESHAGTTPMPLRRDALATLSEIVLAMESIAKKHGPKAVGTIGEAVIANPSRNVIPGEIAFTVDCRSADAAIMDALDKDLRAAVAEIAARRKVDVAARPRLAQAADAFQCEIRRCGGECGQTARLFAPAHHLGRRPRRLQPQHRDAGGDGVRAVQGRHQPQ